MYDYEILSDGICTAFTRLDVKKQIYFKLNKLKRPVYDQSRSSTLRTVYHRVAKTFTSSHHHRQGKNFRERRTIIFSSRGVTMQHQPSNNSKLLLYMYIILQTPRHLYIPVRRYKAILITREHKVPRHPAFFPFPSATPALRIHIK